MELPFWLGFGSSFVSSKYRRKPVYSFIQMIELIKKYSNGLIITIIRSKFCKFRALFDSKHLINSDLIKMIKLWNFLIKMIKLWNFLIKMIKLTKIIWLKGSKWSQFKWSILFHSNGLIITIIRSKFCKFRALFVSAHVIDRMIWL